MIVRDRPEVQGYILSLFLSRVLGFKMKLVLSVYCTLSLIDLGQIELLVLLISVSND
jgi:hypothetical protein